MGDLISREALLNAIDNERKLLIEQGRPGAEHVVVHHARRLIEDLPAIDAAPVVHGRWIITDTHLDNEYDLAGIKTWSMVCRCNNCRFTHHFIEAHMGYAFCPSCGARMDGGEDT